jgi:hypothetical protein
MAKYLLLWSVTLFLAGSAASAEPIATDPRLGGVEQVEPASMLLCPAQEQDVLLVLKSKFVSSCQGDPCTKTSDCRPAGVPDCAQCSCVGPAGDKSCACI